MNSIESRLNTHKGLFIIILLALPLIPPVLYMQMHANQDQKSSIISIPRTSARKEIQPPIIRTLQDKSIHYKLYGRVINVGVEDADGLVIMFVLDADPIQTILAGRMTKSENGYLFTRYGATRADKVSEERVSREKLALVVFEPGHQLEIGLVFNPASRDAQDKSIMSSLDAVLRGNWKQLPTELMPIRSIGVRGRM